MDELDHSLISLLRANARIANTRSSSRSSSPAARRVPLASLSEAERQSMREKGICFFCRKPGHYLRDCPAKKGKVSFAKK